MLEQIMHNQCLSTGSKRCKVSQQSKHPLFSLQRVLQPIMCGKSLWMCPAVQDSEPSGPHLKQGRDLKTEDWTPQYWASHICIIQPSAETEKMILHNNKTRTINRWDMNSVFVHQSCPCIRLHGDRKSAHSPILETHLSFGVKICLQEKKNTFQSYS